MVENVEMRKNRKSLIKRAKSTLCWLLPQIHSDSVRLTWKRYGAISSVTSAPRAESGLIQNVTRAGSVSNWF